MTFIERRENSSSPKMKMAMNRRNEEMVESTDRLIRAGKKPFAIAGAAHFAGETSMLKLMEQRGYTVTQVICEEPIV